MLTLRKLITSSEQHPKFVEEFNAHEDYEDLSKNALVLIAKVSELLSHAGIKNPFITSGWRPVWYNKQIGGSPKSQHIYCRAVDIHDPDKRIGAYCMQNIELLKDLRLYMETLVVTHANSAPAKRWVHLTTAKPRSGDVVFIP